MTIKKLDLDPGQFDILIVDDNPENLKVLGSFLVDQGFNVRAARDGQQALDSVALAPPDIILLDIHMPVLDGYATCQQLKADERYHEIPVIFLSALGETFNKVRAFEMGGADYVVKPFELEEVLMRVSFQLLTNRLLAESRAGFRASFEQAALGMAHLDLDGRITAANKCICALLGHGDESLAGRKVSEVLTEELGEWTTKAIEQIGAGGANPDSCVLRTRAADGQMRWCNATLSVVRVTPNSLPYIVMTLDDVTDQKAGEEERRRLIAALEEAPDSVAITDTDGQMVYVNRACAAAADTTRERLIGSEHPLFTAAASGTEALATLCEELASKGSWHGRLLQEVAAGGKRSEEHRISTLRDGEGSPINYVVVTRDMSVQHRLEGQLRQSQKMEAMGTLAAGIAHDFNNLLAAILGFTELSLEDIPPHTELHDNLREVLGAAERARELVRQILAFGRRSEYEVRSILLQESIDEVLGLLRRSIPPTIAIKDMLDRNCPPVSADGTAVHQILMNLCTNAYHAMEEKGGTLTIRLSCAEIRSEELQGHPELEAGTYARISVCDTGKGMDDVTKNRIFEPYYTTKEKGSGTGLGLATVHGIVSELHGAINVYSELGTGSTFTVLLPVSAEGKQSENVAILSAEQGRNEHILFVDDESSICRFAEKALQRLGYRATVLSDPTKALALFQAAPSIYDVVITDEMMPEMRGSELLVALRTVRPEIPVVLYSGFAGSPQERANAEHQFNGFVMKPMLTSDLAKAIRDVLAGD